MVQSCRFYEKKYPDVGDIVMARVTSIQDMGAYAHLLEYNNIDGMIPHSELSRKRIRSIQKLIRVGRTEPVVVLRVDEQKGYIDLSKRRAQPDEIAIAEDKFVRAKLVNQIIRNVADTCNLSMEELAEKTAWKLARIHKGDLYAGFKACVGRPELLNDCGLDEHTKKILLAKIGHHLKSHKHKIRADIDVTCYGYEGVDAIKAALKAGIACGTDDIPITIKLLAPPHYIVAAHTTEVDEAIDLINNSLLKYKRVLRQVKAIFMLR